MLTLSFTNTTNKIFFLMMATWLHKIYSCRGRISRTHKKILCTLNFVEWTLAICFYPCLSLCVPWGRPSPWHTRSPSLGDGVTRPVASPPLQPKQVISERAAAGRLPTSLPWCEQVQLRFTGELIREIIRESVHSKTSFTAAYAFIKLFLFWSLLSCI